MTIGSRRSAACATGRGECPLDQARGAVGLALLQRKPIASHRRRSLAVLLVGDRQHSGFDRAQLLERSRRGIEHDHRRHAGQPLDQAIGRTAGPDDDDPFDHGLRAWKAASR